MSLKINFYDRTLLGHVRHATGKKGTAKSKDIFIINILFHFEFIFYGKIPENMVE